MNHSVQQLEQRRKQLLAAFSSLRDFRPGSVSAIVRRCGKSSCHCAQPDDPGHGPNLRLTYKTHGKTISESLPTAAAVRKAEAEVAEFRKFEQVRREFVEVNTKICQLRPVEPALTPQEKKRPRRSSKKSHRK
jgi:hypothetical protein